MSKNSIFLLSSSEGQLNMTGSAFRADGYWGHTDGLHTVAIYLQNFQGRIWFEASIANNPSQDDWFAIPITESSFLSFPQKPGFPTGETGDTGTIGMNITGSFTWIRARVDRSYVRPEPISPLHLRELGHVDHILLNN